MFVERVGEGERDVVLLDSRGMSRAAEPHCSTGNMQISPFAPCLCFTCPPTLLSCLFSSLLIALVEG